MGRFRHGRVDLLGAQTAQAQGKSQIIENAHVRIKGIVLKDEGDVALARRQPIDAAAVDGDFSRARLFQSCDKPQERRLAAAGRTEQDAEFAFGDFERNFRENFVGAESLG